MSKSGLLLIAALSATCLPALAQPVRDGAAPPQLEKLEEVTAPKSSAPAAAQPAPSAIRPQITETREQGVVTEVQVKTGNNTYYVKPNVQAGNTMPGDAQGITTRPAQWQVLQFDWKREHDKKTATTNATVVPVPPENAPEK